MPITSVNMKRNQEIEDEHSAITRDENEPKAGFSFAWSVRESICLLFFRTDLAPSSLGLYD